MLGFDGKERFAFVKGGALGPTLVFINKAHVIEAHKVKDGCVKVVDMEFIFDGSKAEFIRYATVGGLLSGKDTPTAFADRMRAFLAQAFTRLDRPDGGKWFGKGDGYLSTEELSDSVVAKLGIGFAYDKIHVRVMLSGFGSDDVSSADKTGDGKLSQGEFEDLYMIAVAKAINPNFSPEPNPVPPAPPAPPAPVEPTPPPAEGPVLPVLPR